MREMELTVKHISKKIKKKEILNDVSMKLKDGTVYGIVGRNGSGKTMLLRALAGLIKIDQGEIWYDDKQLHKDMEMAPSLGLIIENAGLYPEFTGYKNLKLLADIHSKQKSLDQLDYIIFDTNKATGSAV